jgi:hypothetical protein
LYLVIKSASQSLELLSNNYEALQFDWAFCIIISGDIYD